MCAMVVTQPPCTKYVCVGIPKAVEQQVRSLSSDSLVYESPKADARTTHQLRVIVTLRERLEHIARGRVRARPLMVSATIHLGKGLLVC